jgi:hypothetical protein
MYSLATHEDLLIEEVRIWKSNVGGIWRYLAGHTSGKTDKNQGQGNPDCPPFPFSTQIQNPEHSP